MVCHIFLNLNTVEFVDAGVILNLTLPDEILYQKLQVLLMFLVILFQIVSVMQLFHHEYMNFCSFTITSSCIYIVIVYFPPLDAEVEMYLNL